MSYAFINSSVTFTCALPFQITNKYSIAKAKSTHVKVIKQRLKMIKHFLPMAMFPYEHDKKVVDNEYGKSFPMEPLPKKDWRYWVISFIGSNDDLQELEFGLCLLKNEIELGFFVLEDQVATSVGDHNAFKFQFFSDPQRWHDLPVTITSDDLREAARLFNLILAAKANAPSVFAAVQNFFYFKALPSKSVQQVLGYFSVLESLLTHNPNEKEVGDSITHQLKTKLALLEKMFRRSLDYSCFGACSNQSNAAWKQKIWSLLYDYRSCIAHGNHFDFGTKFKKPVSHETVLKFLREVTKLVLIVALEKSEYVEDFKAI